jgi:signal transduction histidine kinase
VLHGISCEFEPAYDETSLTHEMKIDFFRICQESLTNVLDHSLAGKIKISIEDTGSRIQLCILDNGKGFDAREELLTAGLINIRERAASINALINLQANPDGKSCICLTVEKQLSPVV